MANVPIEKVPEFVRRDVERLVRHIALNTLSAVVVATPVGNPQLWQNPRSAPPGYVGGRARGNWQVGISTLGDAETGTVDASGNNTIQRWEALIANYRLGPRILIGNNVPYIQRLNEGHSTQAPKMFVERAVQIGAKAAESFRSQL